MMFSEANLKSMNKDQLIRVISISKNKEEIEFAKNELILRFWK